MITNKDKKILTEVGKEIISEAVMNSKSLKESLSFTEHTDLYYRIERLTYEQVITLLVNEDVRAFENKFKKFLKYGLAAIAGGLLGGPPLAMVTLYLYRKFTDTCEQTCMNNIPMSAKKKMCKYKCQLSIAKSIDARIRSQISKCSTAKNPKKCSDKLTSEHIKWAKRIERIKLKVKKANLDIEAEFRKRTQRHLARQVNAGLEVSVDKSIKFISENKDLRNKLSFDQHLSLYESFVSLLDEEENNYVEPIKIDPTKEKWARIFLNVGLTVTGIPLISTVVNYMVKKYSWSCASKCMANNKLPKSVCYSKCAYMAAKYSTDILKKSLPKCEKSKDPIKCKKKIYKLLKDWKMRETERKIRLQASLRNQTYKQIKKGK